MDDWRNWWLSGGGLALMVTIVIALFGYIRSRPRDLREEIEFLRAHAERCDRELRDLRERLIPELRDENQYLLRKIRLLEDRADKVDRDKKDAR